MERRTVLANTGIAFSAALAGCSELEGDQEDDQNQEDDLGENDSSDDQEQESEEPDQNQEKDDEQQNKEDESNSSDEDQNDTDNEKDDEVEDIDGEVIFLSEDVEEHVAVRDHWFTWSDSEDGSCVVHVELEKTSADKYLISFNGDTTIYSDDGEVITGIGSPNTTNSDMEKGESRVFSAPLSDCEDASKYEVKIRSLTTALPADEIEGEIDMHPDLEGKIGVLDHEFAWYHGPGSDYAAIGVEIKNITSDYLISLWMGAGDGNKHVELMPGDTATGVFETTAGPGTDSYHIGVAPGKEDFEIEEINEYEDVDGEVLLIDDAEDHFAVRDHWLEGSGDGCEIHIELEKTTDSEYHFSFNGWTKLYDENGERITELFDPSADKDYLEKGESRVYSESFPNCEGVAEYEVRVRHFQESVNIPADEMEGEVTFDSRGPEGLEDMIEVVDHGFSWDSGIGGDACSTYVVMKNVTEDYSIGMRGKSLADYGSSKSIEPGEEGRMGFLGDGCEKRDSYEIRIWSGDAYISKVDDSDDT